jgi:hypothetical protein
VPILSVSALIPAVQSSQTTFPLFIFEESPLPLTETVPFLRVWQCYGKVPSLSFPNLFLFVDILP